LAGLAPWCRRRSVTPSATFAKVRHAYLSLKTTLSSVSHPPPSRSTVLDAAVALANARRALTLQLNAHRAAAPT
jgi:hypothetical protein